MNTHHTAPLLAAALLLLAGCSPTTEGTPTPTPDPTPTTTATLEPSPEPSPEPTPEPTPEPSPSFTLDTEQQEAHDTAVEYFTLYNELHQDHDASLQPLINIVTRDALRHVLDEFQMYRESNLLQVGDRRFQILEVDEVSEMEGEPFIEIRACTDSAESDVVDTATGESVMEGRAILQWDLQLVREAGSRWLVASDLNQQVEECGSS